MIKYKRQVKFGAWFSGRMSGWGSFGPGSIPGAPTLRFVVNKFTPHSESSTLSIESNDLMLR